MKFVIVLAVVLATAFAVAMPRDQKENSVELFEKFKVQYSKKYSSHKEEAKRYRIFASNLKKAEKMNTLNPKASFGVNEYTDMSTEEFKTRHNAEKFYKAAVTQRKAIQPLAEKEIKSAPTTVDWRAKGAVTYIKNQGQCGSCWSFSTTGNIEGQWFLAGNKLVALSEQQIVSCDTTCEACNGCWPTWAMEWIVSTKDGWLTGERDYPYLSGNDGEVPACMTREFPKVARITGHHDLPHSEDQMAAYMATNGPLSIGVDASSWQTYNSGIMTNCISTQVDHAVLAVGYDDTHDPPYWIVKNSWGVSWGENGYIRLEKGTDQCLITSHPTNAIVDKTKSA